MRLRLGLFAMIILAGVSPTLGESSISPSGRYKISSVPMKDSDSGIEYSALEIRDLSTKKSLGLVENAGYFKERQDLDEILVWHPKEDLFAILVPDGRKFSNLRICSLARGKLKDLKIPDYVMNALGRVKALRTYNTCCTGRGVWSDDTLTFDLDFNVRDKPEEFGLYKAKVKLLVNDPTGKAWVSLAKVSIVEEFRPGD